MTKSLLGICSKLFVLGLLVMSLGCQKRDDAVAAPQTITDRILEDSQFSMLRAAVTYAGLGDVLKAANLTLFAPNDAAFQASGYVNTTTLLSLPKEQVRAMVLYHALAGSVTTTAIPSGLNAVSMVNQRTAFFNKGTDGSIYVNNAKVTQTSLTEANGYIHVIDRVLTPSAGSLLATIQANANLTLLSAAITRVAASNTAVTAALSSTAASSGVTVFAPNDAAFQAAGYKDVAAINAANLQSLTNTLLYHVSSGVLFANQMQTGQLSTLLSGSKLIVTASSGQFTVKGNKNATSSVVKQADIPTDNGVVHIIDQVLLP